MQLIRRAASFLLAPIIGGLVYSALWFLDPPPVALSFLDNLMWLPVMALVGGIAEVVIGVPALLVFRWRRWSSWVAYAMGGGVIGFIVYVGINEAVFLWTPALKCLVSGAVASVFFRAVGGWASNTSLQRTAGLRPSAAELTIR